MKKRAPGCSFRVLGRARFWPCTPHSKRLFLCIINIVSYGFGNTRGQGPRLSIRPTGSSVFVLVRDVTHVQICEKSASFFEFLGHTWNMSKPVMTFVFQVLRNRLLRYMSKPVMTFVFKVLRIRLLRYILETCPTLWWRSCSKCYAIDCFGTYLKHVQTCDDVRVPSATQSTASVHAQTCDDVRVQSATHSTASVHTWNMSNPVMTFVFKVLRNRLLRYILDTCPNLWWRSCSKCYAIDCFGTCPNLWWRSCSKCYAFDCFGTYLKHVQPCDDVRVQSATQSTASVHTWNMSNPVMTFVCQVLRNRLLRCMPKPVMTFVFKKTTHSTASVHTWNMSNPVMTFVFKVLRNRLLRYILDTCQKLWWCSCSKCYAFDCFGTYLKHVLGRVCSASLWNDVYLVHNDEILMGTAWFRARATKDPKRWLFSGYFSGMKNYPVILGDYFIDHYKDPHYSQPGFNGSSVMCGWIFQVTPW